MALEPKVFKAYDIRGIYPGELDEEGAYAIGRAYAEQFEPATIAVGRDMRLSSPTMQEAFVRGAAEAGVDVLDIGMIGTEMLYYAVGELGLDGGATITASHNPKEYTGAKIVRRGALPVGGDSGLLEIRDRALSLADVPEGQTPGRVETRDVYPGFVDKVLSFIDPGAVKPLRVVIDAANGMAGAMLAAHPRAAAGRRRALLLRARRQLPGPRAEPAPAREPRVHRRARWSRRAPTSGSPSTATPIAASSWTTRASSSPATS